MAIGRELHSPVDPKAKIVHKEVRTFGVAFADEVGDDQLRIAVERVHVGGEIHNRLENPLKFQWSPDGGGNLSSTTFGFDITLLIDICNAIISAESANRLIAGRHGNIAKRALIIVGASAKAGIKQPVYALAGYNPTAEEIIEAFKIYIQQEDRKYEKEFPPELYMQWHRLYDIPVFGGRGRPWHFKHLTVRHIYYPIAKSNGKVYELVKALKALGGGSSRQAIQVSK